jgi:hypothetical protein
VASFASPDDPRHIDPVGLLAVCPTTVTRRTGPGSHEVTVRPRAALADVFDALGVVLIVNVSGGGAGETVPAFQQVPPDDDATAVASTGTPGWPAPDAPVPAAASAHPEKNRGSPRRRAPWACSSRD